VQVQQAAYLTNLRACEMLQHCGTTFKREIQGTASQDYSVPTQDGRWLLMRREIRPETCRDAAWRRGTGPFVETIASVGRMRRSVPVVPWSN